MKRRTYNPIHLTPSFMEDLPDVDIGDTLMQIKTGHRCKLYLANPAAESLGAVTDENRREHIVAWKGKLFSEDWRKL